MRGKRNVWNMLALWVVLALLVTTTGTSVSAKPEEQTELTDPVPKTRQRGAGSAELSGIYDFKDFNFGTGITECPQARLKNLFGDPFDRRQKDEVEQYSSGGDDNRTNVEYTCFPQNETSIDTN